MSMKKRYIVFALMSFALGLLQLADWYFGSEDPIWHIFFYIVVIPIASFAFTVSIPVRCRTLYFFPIYCALCTAVMYIFMGNGGNAIIHGYVFEPGFFDSFDAILLPPLAGGYIGTAVRLIALKIDKKRRG